MSRPFDHLPPPGGAIVIGGDRIGLGVVRSLGRQGIPSWVLADSHRIATVSRYTARTIRWPTDCEQAGVDLLLELAANRNARGWVVFPTSDAAASLLARHHALLGEHLRLTSPPWRVLRWAYDKRLTYQLAAELGVDYPRTLYPSCLDDVASASCEFPVILKPASKPHLNRFTRAKAWRAENRGDLIAKYTEAAELLDPKLIMIQEVIPGGGDRQFSYAALCRDGEPIASITARRTRQYPIDFGYASSFVETIESPGVERAARDILAAMRYTGLAEVELKQDPRDGGLKLLEVNARLWGWHTLGRSAGVDFPFLQFQMASGVPITARRARPGARWIRLSTDLLAAARELRRGSLDLSTYTRALRSPVEWAVFAPDDPLPALLDLPLLMYAEMDAGRRTGADLNRGSGFVWVDDRTSPIGPKLITGGRDARSRDVEPGTSTRRGA
jgi:predicted ATP-grasp superfamily ATP-dependent carboligase